MTSKCLIKRKLPEVNPQTTTKQIRNNHIFGYGKHTYEYNESGPSIELQIPPTRSNSQAAQAEREIKEILDLAREGKTASEICEISGYNRNRVIQVVRRFAEYGAKLAPEPKKKKKRKPPAKINTMWSEEKTNTLIRLHREGLTFAQISEQMGISKSSVSSKVRSLIEAGILKSRMEEVMWTTEELETMMRLRTEGKTWGEISDKIGRGLTACHNAYRREKERRKK